MVHYWCRQFSEGHQSVYDEECSGRPSLINADLVELVRQLVPKTLTSEHKIQRLEAVLTYLQRYRDDCDEFLDRIVMGDETWICDFTPDTKQQSMHWWHSGSPVRTKLKQRLSVRKMMCTMFWTRKGILFIDFLSSGEKVNAVRFGNGEELKTSVTRWFYSQAT
ncbi:uncharacterized protein TNCV_1676811 [Trichonephila clavipes]|nr:uncharacterized protein TNCV_1676811 [Trichonephila clavipes]